MDTNSNPQESPVYQDGYNYGQWLKSTFRSHEERERALAFYERILGPHRSDLRVLGAYQSLLEA